MMPTLYQTNNLAHIGWEGNADARACRVRVKLHDKSFNPLVIIEHREFDGHRTSWEVNDVLVSTPDQARELAQALLAAADASEAARFQAAVHTEETP